MKITNILGLPEPFVDAVKREHVKKEKRYSVTEILKGACQVMLERRVEVEQDVSDMIWLIFGTAVHKVLEDSQETASQIKEGKIEINIGDYTLSGIFDLYDEKEKKVTDYKTATVWKVVHDDWEDYRKQLLMYAYMLRKLGFECDKGEIVAVLKDHSKSKAETDADYPKFPVHKELFVFDDKDFKFIEELINKKFEELKIAEKTPSDELKECTPEERWQSEDEYAVMKEGRKKAIRVLDSREEAELYITNNMLDKKHYIQKRVGESKRCKDYCTVAEHCPFYKRIKEVKNA